MSTTATDILLTIIIIVCMKNLFLPTSADLYQRAHRELHTSKIETD